jgi:hypothetical protein
LCSVHIHARGIVQACLTANGKVVSPTRKSKVAFPADGKIIEADDALNSDGSVDLPGKRTDDQRGSS